MLSLCLSLARFFLSRSLACARSLSLPPSLSLSLSRSLPPSLSLQIFDSRTLHCGGANESPPDATAANSRALFYITFKNPKVVYAGNPGSLRPEMIGAFTLSTLRSELAQESKKPGSSEKLQALNGRMR